MRDVSTGDTARVEGSHRKLCTRLTDGLCGDDTDSLADVDGVSGSKVCTVAVYAHTVLCTAVEGGADVNSFNACRNNLLDLRFVHHYVRTCENLARCGIDDRLNGVSAEESVCKRLDKLVALLDGVYPKTFGVAAVDLTDNNILRYIDKASCKVTGVGCTKRRIGKTFTGAAGGDEVLQDVKTFTEVCLDRKLDGLT